MEASLFNIFYLAFRFMPFLLVSYYIISFSFHQQYDAILLLGGLILTCVLAFMVGGMSMFRAGSSGGNMCSVIALSKNQVLSPLPLSTVVYSFLLSYLGIPILHYNRNQSNLPILILFPILLFLDMLWLFLFGCSTALNILTAGIVGMVGGLTYSELVFLSAYKNVQYDSILTDKDDCNYSAVSGFHCVQRTQQGADHVADAMSMEANVLLNSYSYLTKILSQNSEEIQNTLKQGADYLSKKTSTLSGLSSALTGQPGSKASMTTFPGVRMTGSSYSQLSQVSSPEVCVAKCGTDLSCVAFVYDSKRMSCTFHSSIGADFSNNIANYSTYFKNPSPAFLTIPATKVSSTPMQDISGVVPSPLLCGSFCLDTSGCHGYVYGNQTGKCSLYGSAIDIQTNYIDASASSIGILQVQTVEETNYTDPDYSTIEGVANVNQCLKACISNPQCVGLTYNTFDAKNHVCHMKSSMKQALEGRKNMVSFLFPQGDGMNAVASTRYAEWNMSSSGNFQSVSRSCQRDPTCIGFLYKNGAVGSAGQFSFIRAETMLTTPVSEPGTTTFFKQGSDPFAMQQYKEIPQTNIVKGDVDGLQATLKKTTQQTCAHTCLGNNDCIGFTFDLSSNSCTLKKRFTGGGAYIVKGDPAISTFVEQPYGYTAYLNKMLPISQADASLEKTTPNGCATLCQNTPSCSGFVYSHTTNQCYTKVEVSSPKTEAGYILYSRDSMT